MSVIGSQGRLKGKPKEPGSNGKATSRNLLAYLDLYSYLHYPRIIERLCAVAAREDSLDILEALQRIEDSQSSHPLYALGARSLGASHAAWAHAAAGREAEARASILFAESCTAATHGKTGETFNIESMARLAVAKRLLGENADVDFGACVKSDRWLAIQSLLDAGLVERALEVLGQDAITSSAGMAGDRWPDIFWNAILEGPTDLPVRLLTCIAPHHRLRALTVPSLTPYSIGWLAHEGKDELLEKLLGLLPPNDAWTGGIIDHSLLVTAHQRKHPKTVQVLAAHMLTHRPDDVDAIVWLASAGEMTQARHYVKKLPEVSRARPDFLPKQLTYLEVLLGWLEGSDAAPMTDLAALGSLRLKLLTMVADIDRDRAATGWCKTELARSDFSDQELPQVIALRAQLVGAKEAGALFKEAVEAAKKTCSDSWKRHQVLSELVRLACKSGLLPVAVDVFKKRTKKNWRTAAEAQLIARDYVLARDLAGACLVVGEVEDQPTHTAHLIALLWGLHRAVRLSTSS